MEGLTGYGSNEEDSDKDSELQPMPQAPTSSSHPVYPVNVGAISNSRHFPAPAPNNGSGAAMVGSISTALTVAGSTGAGVDPQMTNRRFRMLSPHRLSCQAHLQHFAMRVPC